ncbi:MAG: discoidin domain-containing protein [Paludibacter sp.]|nr:discoidin domain-containing protein [Bacteroidales bacterium]MCM1069148.1 discoidin domain-containing protein [Prevotella sp.]MCM1353587.1 discoidin domain-containing protein [Bacteroides sp.]MCM1442748.1 discoidin domain-containing protein [Muribaculum sp.]MCM1481616.1 discoidin domain-containing protein [Paludibacter sp.]
MKRTHRLFILLLFLLLTTNLLRAAQYCVTEITSENGKHKASITCSSLGNNMYQFVFASEDVFTGYNAAGSNFYMNVNGVGGYHVSEHLAQDGNKLTALIESDVVPNIYVGAFFVMYADGEALFQIPTDADFSQECDEEGGGDIGGGDKPFDTTVNLALGKPSFAGKDTNNAWQSNDGSLGTRWGSNGGADDEHWWYVDLGDFYLLNEIDLFWEAAFSDDFILQGAMELPANPADDALWKTFAIVKGTQKVGQDENAKNVHLVDGAARYVRIRSFHNVTTYGISMWEFRVYGTGLATPDDAKPILTKAEFVSMDENQGTVQLALEAMVTREGVLSPVYDFFITDANTGQHWRVNTNADDNTGRLSGFVSCGQYDLKIEAVDALYNLSEPMYCNFVAPASNLALGRPCQAGYSQGNDVLPEKAVDGNNTTRWSGWGSNENDKNCWWQVDLEGLRTVNDIKISFENNQVRTYSILASVDGNSWVTLGTYDNIPQTGANNFVDFPLSATCRYLRIEANQNLSFYEFCVYGECFALEQSQNPHMLYADLEQLTTTTATLHVGATDDTTPFEELTYRVVLTVGNNVLPTIETKADNGYLTLTDLDLSTYYIAEIWAIDADGNLSDNSITLTFTTLGEFANLYLSGDINGWVPNDENYRFRTTAIPGIYSLTLTLPAGTHIVYKLTDGTALDSDHSTLLDHHFIFPQSEVTFYAKDFNTFASSGDSIFLQGTLIDATSLAEGRYCTWNGTQAVWVGDINILNPYQITKVSYLNGTTDAYMPFLYDTDISVGNQMVTGVSATKAQFTFDLPSLTWYWKDYHDGYCAFYGTAGDGFLRGKNEKDITFSQGYNLELWLNETKDVITIQVEYLDTDKEAANAIFLNYPNKEFAAVKERLLTTIERGRLFRGDVQVADLLNKDDGMIRFVIKFSLPNGEMRLTNLEYFYLDGAGCAERIFTIYHHDDMPAEPEHGAVISYKGGRILQPIRYKRIFKPDTWETLCLPFSVSKVTVYDPDDNQEYELYAQYSNGGQTNEGHFWLRTFTQSAVSVNDFKANWHDIEATSAATALPQKGIPYIMRMPAGDYYADKYVIFHGEEYQTIAATYAAPALPDDDKFSYSGNNTMMPWNLRSAYVLDAPGEYFVSDESVVLQPFECAVNATQATIARIPRLGLNASNHTITDTNLPTTSSVGTIYSVMGLPVGRFASSDEYDNLLQRLSRGIYVVQTETSVTKIYVGD